MIDTRTYALDDAAGFLTLYRACLRHYDIPPATAAQEDRILSLLAAERHMSCLMAYEGVTPLGFATWALTFPAAAGTVLYMKEIFVRDSARGKGVGRHLLAGLIGIAAREGCVRFDWQTDGDNHQAQDFYAAIGAPAKHNLSFRVEATDFDGFRARLF